MRKQKDQEFNQIKYQNEFNKKNYDRIEITVPKGEKANIKAAAENKSMSVSEYLYGLHKNGTQ